MQCKSSAQPDLLLFMETEHSKKAIAVPPRGLGYHSTNFGDVNSKRALWGNIFPERLYHQPFRKVYSIQLNCIELARFAAFASFCLQG